MLGLGGGEQGGAMIIVENAVGMMKWKLNYLVGSCFLVNFIYAVE